MAVRIPRQPDPSLSGRGFGLTEDAIRKQFAEYIERYHPR